MTRKHRFTAFIIVLGVAWVTWSMFASAQPGQPKQPKPPAAKQKGPPLPVGKDGKPKMQLPPGHPPINPGAGRRGKGNQGKVGDRDQRRRALEELRKRRGNIPGLQPGGQRGRPADAAAPPKKKFPRDAHGHCLGDGANDRPKDINLLHGWFMANNDKAVPAPPKSGGEPWWGSEYLGNSDWWIWRITPYPYRYENHDDHCDPRNQPVPLIANVVNLGFLIFLFVRFGKKPMLAGLRERKKSIMSEIDKARDIKKSAQAKLDKYEDELKHLDDRLEQLRGQYAAEGEVEEARVREDMAETRERMMADARFRVEQEHKTARDQLSTEALTGAMKAAEELLKTSVTDADHERLAEEYLDQIGPALKEDTGLIKDPGGRAS